MNEEQTPELNETETTAPVETESGLSPRHERFCREYLKDFNASAAARRAGYQPTGAHTTGYRILNLPEVQKFLHEEQAKINATMSLATQAVNKQLLEITYLDRGEFLDEHGDLKNLKDLPENLRAAVQVSTKKIKCDDKVTTVTSYSLFNKIQMMEKISKRQLPDNKAVANNPIHPADQPEIVDLGDGITVEV